MRDAFFRALTELGAADERVWALTGDLGVGLFEPFEAVAPGRYLNVGIAEQTLVGVAAGLAYAGKVPFAYSIAPFITSRPHDQVRVDVACAEANVKLVGVGSGVSYGTLGPTHHAIEDLALMRVLPGMTVLAPGDPAEAGRAVRAAGAHDGPVYLRLGKNGEPSLLPADAPFAIGCALELRRGGDVTIAATGTALREATAAADLLAGRWDRRDAAPLRHRQAVRRRRAGRGRGAHRRRRHRRGAHDRRRLRHGRRRGARRGGHRRRAAPRRPPRHVRARGRLARPSGRPLRRSSAAAVAATVRDLLEGGRHARRREPPRERLPRRRAPTSSRS